jgi:serine/threonine protein kinase
MASTRTTPGITVSSSVPNFISERTLMPAAKSISYKPTALRQSKLVQIDDKTYFQKTLQIHIEEYKLHLDKKIRKAAKQSEERNSESQEMAKLEEKAKLLEKQSTLLKTEATLLATQKPVKLEEQASLLKTKFDLLNKRSKLLSDKLLFLNEKRALEQKIKQYEGFRQIENDRLEEHGEIVENYIFREFKGFIREIEVLKLLQDTDYSIELNGVSFSEEFFPAYLAASIIASGATEEPLFAFFSVFYSLVPHLSGKLLPNISIVTEYMVNGSLFDMIEDSNKLNTLQRIKIGRDIAVGMQLLDAKGIVHRDIKPDNVMITISEKGIHAKLIDFQTALLREKNNDVYGIGSPYYAASIGSFEARDIYSLGRSLLHLFLADTKRFRDGEGVEALQISKCPYGIKLLIEHCLSINYHARPSIQTIIAILDEAIQTELAKPVNMNTPPYLKLTETKQAGANQLAQDLLEGNLKIDYSSAYWRGSDYKIAELFNILGSSTIPQYDACIAAFKILTNDEYFKWFADERFATDNRFNKFVSYLNFTAPAGKTSRETLIQLCQKEWRRVSDSYLNQMKSRAAKPTNLMIHELTVETLNPNASNLAIHIGALMTDYGKICFLEILNTPSLFRSLFSVDQGQIISSNKLEEFKNFIRIVPDSLKSEALKLISTAEYIWKNTQLTAMKQKNESAAKLLAASDSQLENAVREELSRNSENIRDLGAYDFYKLLLKIGADAIDGDDGKEALLRVARQNNSAILHLMAKGNEFAIFDIRNSLENRDELRGQVFFEKLASYTSYLISEYLRQSDPVRFKELSDYFDSWLAWRNLWNKPEDAKVNSQPNQPLKQETALQAVGMFSQTVTIDKVTLPAGIQPLTPVQFDLRK